MLSALYSVFEFLKMEETSFLLIKGEGSGNNRSYMKGGSKNITKAMVYVLNDSIRERLQMCTKDLEAARHG